MGVAIRRPKSIRNLYLAVVRVLLQEGASRHGSTQDYSSVLQKCGATARLVQLQFLDLETPSRRNLKTQSCEGEPPDYRLSQSLAGKPTINAG